MLYSTILICNEFYIGMLVTANEVLIDQGSWILAEVHRHPQHQTQGDARLHRAACCQATKKKKILK